MTRPEFLRGWMILTTQPWGKAYRSTFQIGTGEPSPADIQAEFYYTTFAAYPPDAWVQACEQLATGEHWPSVDALKLNLKHATRSRPALPAPAPTYITKEEFGLNLYETIKTISGIKAIDQHRANAIHKGEGHKVQELMTRRKALQASLVKQLPALTDSEMDQLLARYPFVTGY